MTTTSNGARTTRAPWFVYARKSRIGVGAHITKENQWEACADYVQSVAGPDAPMVKFFDNASGYDETAYRAQWEDMLARIRRGEAAGVVGWHVDRFTRIPEVGEHLWKACKANGTQLHTKLGGHQTSALAFRVQNAVAADESEIKSERQKLKHAQLAADGLPHGGRRAYGYDRKRQNLVPDEAAHIRWAADQILAGRSLRNTTLEMTERGARNVAGNPWKPANLGVYLRRPMIAGLRVHHEKIVGPASWPAILDLGKWEAVRTLLENPDRRVSKSAPRVYLLSGIARCGVCDGPMRGRSNSTVDQPAAYFCDNPGKHTHRRVDMVDAQVRAEVVARLAEVDATGALVAPAEPGKAETVQAAIRELEERQDGLMALRMDGSITERQLVVGTQKAEQMLADLRQELADMEVEQRRPVAVLEGLAGAANAAAIFDGHAPMPDGRFLDLEGRRAVVSELVTVVIHPQGRGGPHGPERYNPSRVVVEPVVR